MYRILIRLAGVLLLAPCLFLADLPKVSAEPSINEAIQSFRKAENDLFAFNEKAQAIGYSPQQIIALYDTPGEKLPASLVPFYQSIRTDLDKIQAMLTTIISYLKSHDEILKRVLERLNSLEAMTQENTALLRENNALLRQINDRVMRLEAAQSGYASNQLPLENVTPEAIQKINLQPLQRSDLRAIRTSLQNAISPSSRSRAADIQGEVIDDTSIGGTSIGGQSEYSSNLAGSDQILVTGDKVNIVTQIKPKSSKRTTFWTKAWNFLSALGITYLAGRVGL